MSTPSPEPVRIVAPDLRVAARVEDLYAAHAKQIRSICRGLLRDRTEADDAVQQTFLSAHRALANGSSPREPAAWLATIARNECLARVRARMRDPLPVDPETHEAELDAHTAAVQRDEVGRLRDALAELPAQQRDAILLRELRGLSYEEVAHSLSVTTSAVESLLFRARRSLQANLRDALAALSPGNLVQPLRDLAGRLVGGGLLAPAAAKVAALGLGTAVVTGGAVVGSQEIGLGHAPARPRTVTAASSTRPAGHRADRGTSPPLVFAAAALNPVRTAAETRPHGEDGGSSGSSAARPESGDRQSGSAGEQSSGSGDAGSGSDGATSTTSSSTDGGSDSGSGSGDQTSTTSTTSTTTTTTTPSTTVTDPTLTDPTVATDATSGTDSTSLPTGSGDGGGD